MTKKLYAYAASGGGVRIGATFGAQLKAKELGKWQPERFDIITGNSSGSLDAAFTASGLEPEQKVEIFKRWNIAELLSRYPWKLRLATALVNPISMDRLADKIDSLNMPSSPRCYVNAWDCRGNKQIIFCEKKPEWAAESWIDTVWEEDAFNRFGWGKVLTRSMALPGMVADELKYMDGGIAEHPPLSFIPRDAHILLINLGYPDFEAGFKRDMLSRVSFAYSAIRSHMLDTAIGHFEDLYSIKPKVYDWSAYDFEVSNKDIDRMIEKAKVHTNLAWRSYVLPE